MKHDFGNESDPRMVEADWTPDGTTAVLAFSGGLDTSFCVPFLVERGYRVVTIFCDSGGVNDEERSSIESRARHLGAAAHHTVDVSDDLWRQFVVPFIKGGTAYQDQYPLLCSDRYMIVAEALRLCRELGTNIFAHGCTGMGNDQVRFDLTVKTLGEFEIIAPIREIQDHYPSVREYEQQYLVERGFETPTLAKRYTINENLLGATISGSEIDSFDAPGDDTHVLTRPANEWPKTSLRMTIAFEQGEAVALDGLRVSGPEMLRILNDRFGAYGIGRGIYTGDTTIGLKGRIVFESPGLSVLMEAHRALEEAVLSRFQNAFKPRIARMWTDLVYQGFFFEPLKADLESFVDSTQEFVTGEVVVETSGGVCRAVALRSDHILKHGRAEYAQSADWGRAEAEGFIRLFGQSSVVSSRINPRMRACGSIENGDRSGKEAVYAGEHLA